MFVEERKMFIQKNKSTKKTFTKVVRGLVIFSLVAGILGVLLYSYLIKPGLILMVDAKEGVALARVAKDDLRKQDFKKLQSDVSDIGIFSTKFKDHYSKLNYLSYVPFVSSYYGDGWHFLKASDHGLRAADLVLKAVDPFSSLLGFGVESKPVSVEEKLAQLVKIVPQLSPSLEEASSEINSFIAEVDYINSNNYPEVVGNFKIRDSIKGLKNQLDALQYLLSQSKPFLASLPGALGYPTPKTYLILFQNDKELRPTGGFISAYSLVSITDGKISVIKSDDIYPLDQDRTLLPAPQPILDFLKVSGFYMRDTNFSPDFKKSMQDFEVYYKASGAPPISGIIALDTHFLERLLELSGPLTIPGYTFDFAGSSAYPASCRKGGIAFTADNVVCRLEVYAEKLMIGGGRDRKAMLGDLMKKLLDWLLTAPSSHWGQITNTTIAEAQGKHLLVYFHDLTLQDLAENYNFAGRIRSYSGDYLGVFDANLASAKSDLYINRKIEQSIIIKADGTIRKKVTLTYANTAYADGWLNTTYRDYQRIYVPKGSTLVSSSGGDLKAKVYDDLDKTVFSNFFRVPPKTTVTLSYEYDLPFKSKGDHAYNLLVQKQGGIDAATYSVNFNGQTKNFELTKDEELTFSY